MYVEMHLRWATITVRYMDMEVLAAGANCVTAAVTLLGQDLQFAVLQQVGFEPSTPPAWNDAWGPW